MNRRNFLTKSCLACASATAFVSLLQSCAATRYISGDLGKDGVSIRKNDFKSENGSFSSFVVIRNEALLFPLCVFRLQDDSYSALWMKCTHQGAVLQASGDVLQCTAHGSEFNNKGEVIQGPAALPLRAFPVIVKGEEIFIDLRKPA